MWSSMDILPAPKRVGTYLNVVDGFFMIKSTSARNGFACAFLDCVNFACRRFFVPARKKVNLLVNFKIFIVL